jgi:REP element-mobilizing transposase RayT
MKLHKNSPKRIIFPGAVYYIVIKTQANYPYFKETIFCDLFMENLKICKKLKGFKLYGFSVIYDHINLLIKPSEKYNISQVMKSLKRNISRNINIVMGLTNDYAIKPVGHPVGDTILCRLRGSDLRKKEKILGLFKGQDDYLWKLDLDLYKKRFTDKFGVNKYPYPKFQWQKSFYDYHIRFHDNIARQEKDWDYHYNYTVYNHIKHGLPADWKYTSLNFPELVDSIDN